MEKMPYRDRPGLRAVTPAAGDCQQRLARAAARAQRRAGRVARAAAIRRPLAVRACSRATKWPGSFRRRRRRSKASSASSRGLTGSVRAGAYACFAVTLKGYDTAIGIFQVRELEPGFATAEWGFAIGSAFWGTGVFKASADLVLEFAFDTLGVHRLEARAAVRNGRGTGALRKTRRRPGRAAAEVVSPQWRVSRSGAVRDPVRRLARRARTTRLNPTGLAARSLTASDVQPSPASPRPVVRRSTTRSTIPRTAWLLAGRRAPSPADYGRR